MIRTFLALSGAVLLALASAPVAGAASPPGGNHDGASGAHGQYDCYANGWAVDPDDVSAAVTVRVLVDDVEVARLQADDFRQDVKDAGVSPTGNASFWLDLWGVVTPDVDHVVRVEALDLGVADAWTALAQTPRTLRCHEYGWFDFDLFSVDPVTHAVKQLTSTPGVGEWNPEAAPTGSRIVYDVARPSGQSLAIKNTSTGATRALAGATGGNNGTWTPDGKRIVFDRGPSGDPSLYTVPAAGGQRRLITRNGVEADVSAMSGRVVFLNPATSRIMTIGQSGTDRKVVVTLRHKVDPAAKWFDVSPEWSPNGRWIVYADGGDIWKIKVTRAGTPLAKPVRVIARAAVECLPTWSRDGARIIYQAAYGGSTDLWSIPASGGVPTLLTPKTGIVGFGDYNGSQRDGGRVIYSSQQVVDR